MGSLVNTNPGDHSTDVLGKQRCCTHTCPDGSSCCSPPNPSGLAICYCDCGGNQYGDPWSQSARCSCSGQAPGPAGWKEGGSIKRSGMVKSISRPRSMRRGGAVKLTSRPTQLSGGSRGGGLMRR